MDFFLLLFLFGSLSATAYDFTGNYHIQKEPLELFKFLVFTMPEQVCAGDAVLLKNPLVTHVSTLDACAYKTEGERVLAAYLCAFKRINPERELHLLFESDGCLQEYVLDSDAEKYMQHYELRDFSRSLDTKIVPEFSLGASGCIEREAVVISPKIKDATKQCVVVTGCAGFLGSALTKLLLEKGYAVIGIDNCICADMRNIVDILEHENFCYCAHDITIPFTIDGCIDAVVNCASIPSPAFYYKMPLETLDVGLKGTLNTLDLAVAKKARYLFTSTSEVYGNPEVNPQPETYAGNVDPLGIRAQYDESKRGAETLINLYFQKYNLDVRVARIFNTYGPGMRLRDGRVITNFLGALLHDQPLVIHGSGQQTRSFAYVDDTVLGIAQLLENNSLSQAVTLQERIFNIGTPAEFTINQLAEIVKKIGQEIVGKNVPIEHIARFDKTDPDLRRPDITKARDILQWEPSVELYAGLCKTLEYFIKLGE